MKGEGLLGLKGRGNFECGMSNVEYRMFIPGMKSERVLRLKINIEQPQRINAAAVLMLG